MKSHIPPRAPAVPVHPSARTFARPCAGATPPRPAATRQRVLHAGRAAALAALLLGLGGCGAVTPGGLVAASRLDPLATDPADLSAAVALPETIRLRPGDVHLRLAFAPTDGDAAGAATVDESFALDLAEGVPGPEAAEGERVVVARVAATDLARLRAAQTRIGAARAAGVRGGGALSIDVRGGCRIGPMPEALPLRTFLRTAPEGPFVQLTRTTDLLGLLDADTAAALRAAMPPC